MIRRAHVGMKFDEYGIEEFLYRSACRPETWIVLVAHLYRTCFNDMREGGVIDRFKMGQYIEQSPMTHMRTGAVHRGVSTHASPPRESRSNEAAFSLFDSEHLDSSG